MIAMVCPCWLTPSAAPALAIAAALPSCSASKPSTAGRFVPSTETPLLAQLGEAMNRTKLSRLATTPAGIATAIPTT
ncbi:hypothetical protein [Microbacterium sp. Nx66]|uniref:hypothetical protein n=1 Tax=Microbacterium sp. Nx66 TaxID=2766784 RepID=UPI001E5ECFA4|nr:hypothetical protein [Microbacterium sp. Nx66]